MVGTSLSVVSLSMDFRLLEMTVRGGMFDLLSLTQSQPL